MRGIIHQASCNWRKCCKHRADYNASDLTSLRITRGKPMTRPAICPSDAVPELGKYAFTVEHRGTRLPALLIRHQGTVYGYINQCVHMPRTLDCEQPEIFDESGRYLQCSMHTIHYDPATGDCLSEICAGKKLAGFKVEERDGAIYLIDRKTKLAKE
jgi:nitrite reductase/ring-hydroxylating ferredoxin subunit